MATHRQPYFGRSSKPLVDPTPMPSDVPDVQELGVTSAPLKSASFFMGNFCKDFSEDFMLCKAENRDPEHCLKEGRRVTRCAQEAIGKIKGSCLEEFNKHWQCLELNNQMFENCRKPERVFNACMFDKLEFKKTVPGTPDGYPQIHEKKWPIYGQMQR